MKRRRLNKTERDVLTADLRIAKRCLREGCVDEFYSRWHDYNRMSNCNHNCYYCLLSYNNAGVCHKIQHEFNSWDAGREHDDVLEQYVKLVKLIDYIAAILNQGSYPLKKK